jgi:hypothetical protein
MSDSADSPIRLYVEDAIAKAEAAVAGTVHQWADGKLHRKNAKGEWEVVEDKQAHHEFKERHADPEAVALLERMGDALHSVDEVREQNDIGFNKLDYQSWGSARGDVERMRRMLRKYRRQLVGHYGLEAFIRVGLADPPPATADADLVGQWTSNGGLHIRTAQYLGDKFAAFKDIHRTHGFRWNGERGAAARETVPPTHPVAQDPSAYVAALEKRGIKIHIPEKPEIVEQAPVATPVAQPPTPPRPVDVYEVASAIVNKRARDTIALVQEDDGRFVFYSTFSRDFNEIMSNKTGKLTGIIEADPRTWSRSTFSHALMEEALEKLRAALPHFTFVLDPKIKDAADKAARDKAAAEAPIPEVQAKLAPGFALKPYQNAMVRFLDGNDGNAIVGDEMGLGKTLQALAWVAKNNKKAIVVVPKVVRRTWIQEAHKFFPGHFDAKELRSKDLLTGKGKKGTDLASIDDPAAFLAAMHAGGEKGLMDLSGKNLVTVNYESLEKFMPYLKAAGFDTLIVDECFGPETLVDTPTGPRRIDQIQVGDIVLSALGPAPVLGAFRRSGFANRIELRYGSTSVTCSAHHPFFTGRGWIYAEDLKPGDTLVSHTEAMRLLREDLHAASEQESFLRDLLFSEVEDEPSGLREEPDDAGREGCSAGGEYWEEEPGVLGADEGEQPDAQCRDARQGVGVAQGDGLEADGAQRQRYGTDRSRANATRGARPSVEVESRDQPWSATARLSHQLQSRPRIGRSEAQRRSGWLLALVSERPGFQERGEVAGVRVGDVTVHQSGSYPGNEAGHYYDLKVAGHPSFSVGGVLVHNSHRAKNPKAKTTKAIQSVAKITQHHILMSGTAVKNRKDELFTQLEMVVPGLWGSAKELKGATHGAAWNKMRPHYLARTKAEVLKDLPPKQTTISTLYAPGAPDIGEVREPKPPPPGATERQKAAYAKAAEDFRESRRDEENDADLYAEAVGEYGAGGRGAPSTSVGEYSRIRGQLALAKAPATVEMVKEILGSSDSKVLVFSESVAAAKAIVAELGDEAILHYGQQSDDVREAAKAEFMREGSPKRVFVSTRPSLAVGATLTAADKVVFNDLPWTAADIGQAEDRAHRIGQQNAVNIYWVVAEDNKFDENVTAILRRKYDLAAKINQGKQISPAEREWMEKPLAMADVLAKIQGKAVEPPPSTPSAAPTTPIADATRTLEAVAAPPPAPAPAQSPPTQPAPGDFKSHTDGSGAEETVTLASGVKVFLSYVAGKATARRVGGGATEGMDPREHKRKYGRDDAAIKRALTAFEKRVAALGPEWHAAHNAVYGRQETPAAHPIPDPATKLTASAPPPPQGQLSLFKADIRFRGLHIHVENPAGSTRQWFDEHTGEHGETEMQFPYGEIHRTEGLDGDKVDVYVGPNENAENVYVVHQMKKRGPNGAFADEDEDKVMLGFPSQSEAVAAYLTHYSDPRFLGGVTVFPFEEFVERLQGTRQDARALEVPRTYPDAQKSDPDALQALANNPTRLTMMSWLGNQDAPKKQRPPSNMQAADSIRLTLKAKKDKRKKDKQKEADARERFKAGADRFRPLFVRVEREPPTTEGYVPQTLRDLREGARAGSKRNHARAEQEMERRRAIPPLHDALRMLGESDDDG